MDVTNGAAPVVRLSGIGPVDENAVWTTPDVELDFEYDSDRSELGEGEEGEDPDSNSEGYYGNDYPEVRCESLGGQSVRGSTSAPGACVAKLVWSLEEEASQDRL